MLNKKRYGEWKEAPTNESREFHIPKYNFCGPGTQVKARLERGDLGVNELDEACRLHDVEYMMYAGDPKMLGFSDQKLIYSALKVENEINRLKEEKASLFSISGIANFLFDKIGMGSVVDLIENGFAFDKGYGLQLATKIVANLFSGKSFLEKMGIIDPVSWAKMLNGDESDEEIRKEGLEMFKKYF